MAARKEYYEMSTGALQDLYIERFSPLSQKRLCDRWDMINSLRCDDFEKAKAKADVEAKLRDGFQKATTSEVKINKEDIEDEKVVGGYMPDSIASTYWEMPTCDLRVLFLLRFASPSRDNMFERDFMIKCLRRCYSEADILTHPMDKLENMFYISFAPPARKHYFEHSFMVTCLRSDDAEKRYAHKQQTPEGEGSAGS